VFKFLYYSTIESEVSGSVITEEGVAALDLLIGGSTNNKSVYSVLCLATMQSEISKYGDSKVRI